MKIIDNTKEITDNDKCCICGKILFINGKRQTNLCYHLGLSRERILKMVGMVVIVKVGFLFVNLVSVGITMNS